MSPKIRIGLVFNDNRACSRGVLRGIKHYAEGKMVPGTNGTSACGASQPWGQDGLIFDNHNA